MSKTSCHTSSPASTPLTGSSLYTLYQPVSRGRRLVPVCESHGVLVLYTVLVPYREDIEGTCRPLGAHYAHAPMTAPTSLTTSSSRAYFCWRIRYCTEVG